MLLAPCFTLFRPFLVLIMQTALRTRIERLPRPIVIVLWVVHTFLFHIPFK